MSNFTSRVAVFEAINNVLVVQIIAIHVYTHPQYVKQFLHESLECLYLHRVLTLQEQCWNLFVVLEEFLSMVPCKGLKG